MNASLFVLIHSPLVGCLTWEGVAARLRRSGHEVVVPSLSAALEGDPPYYNGLAQCATEVVAQVQSIGEVIVVGHSGTGALLPAITGRIGSRVRTAIFVDAILPHPGASWLEIAPAGLRAQLEGRTESGRLPPWHEWFPGAVLDALIPDAELRERFIVGVPRVPVGYIEEAAPEVVGWPPERCIYLRLSAAYEREANDAESLGWVVHRASLHHLAMLTDPNTVADLLLNLTD